MADNLDLLAQQTLQEEDAKTVRQNLMAGFDTNPDRAAEINRLSQKTGAPAFALNNDPATEADVRTRSRLEDIAPEDLVKTHPMTAGALKNPDFAKIAHDDVQNLKGLEDAYSSLGTAKSSALDEVLAGVEKQGANAGYLKMLYAPEGDLEALAQFVAERNKPLADATARQPAYYKNALNDIQKYSDKYKGSVGEWVSGLAAPFVSAAKSEKPFQVLGRMAASQLPNSILPMVSAYAMGKAGAAGGGAIGAVIPVPGAAPTGAVVGGVGGAVAGGFMGSVPTEIAGWFDQQLVAKGVDTTDAKQIMSAFRDTEWLAKTKAEAERKGLTTAAVDAAWNVLFAGKFTKNMAKVGSVATMQGAKTLARNVGKVGTDVAVQSVGEGTSEAAGQYAAVGTVNPADVGMEMLGGLGQSMFDVKQFHEIRRGTVNEAANLVADQKRSEIDALSTAAANTKVLLRDPAAVREMVDAVNPAAKVYVDHEIAQQFYQELDPTKRAALDAAIPELPKLINESAVSGADVEISRADYMAYIAATEEGKALRDHIKFDANDLTVAQLTDPTFMDGMFEAPFTPKAQDAVSDFEDRLVSDLVDSGRLIPRNARASVQPLVAGLRTLLANEKNTALIKRLFDGISAEGPALQAHRKSILDMTDKTINDMREYAARVSKLNDARMKAFETRQANAIAKAQKTAQETGMPYVPPAPPKMRAPSRHLPVLKYLAANGGVKIDSPLAAELKGMGLTSKNAPWLFRKDNQRTATMQGVKVVRAFTDLDTLSAQALNDAIGGDYFLNTGTDTTDTNGYYVDPAHILDAISSELSGNPVVSKPTDPMEAQFEDFTQYLDRIGLDLNTASNEEIKAALQNPDAFLGTSDAGAQKQDSGGVFFQSALDGENLIVLHNIKERGLQNASKIGGLPVPSLAITRNDIPFTSFGDITLIAPSSMADPKADKASKSFDADVYSPRYPTVKYSINRKAYDAAVKRIVELTGNVRPNLTDTLDQYIEDRGTSDLQSNEAVKYAYMRDKGMDVPIVYKDRAGITAKYPELKKWRGKDRFDMRDDPAFIADLTSAVKDMIGDNADLQAAYFGKTGALDKNVISNYAIEISRSSDQQEVDGYAFDKAVRDAKVDENDLADWVKNLFDGVVAKEQIFDGYTPSGNRKYLEHNLDNVVRILKRGLKDGEGWNYGIGSVRGALAKKFSSLKAIKADSKRLITEEEMNAVKEEIQSDFDALAAVFTEKMKYQGRFGGLDELTEHLKEFGQSRRRSTLDQYYNDLTDEDIAQAKAFIEKLVALPTQYFEVKMQRAVQLSEFVGAVVNDTAKPETLKVLDAAGIPYVKYKANDEKARAEAVKSFSQELNKSGKSRVLFQSQNEAEYTADKIVVDGVERGVVNNKGERIARTQTELENFWRWFGDSKVVDAQGRPLVMYHGTDQVFDAFELGKKKNEGQSAGGGFYFSTQEIDANRYARLAKEKNGGNEVVYSTYLKIGNPFIAGEKNTFTQSMFDVLKKHWNVSDSHLEGKTSFWFKEGFTIGNLGNIDITPKAKIELLKAGGYDGVKDGGHRVAFDPTQIKSVNNTGAFDPSNPSILNQQNRGQVSFMRNGDYLIKLFGTSDLSTFLHESGHVFLDIYHRVSSDPEASQQIKDDMAAILNFLGVQSYDQLTREHHEKFAKAFEEKLMTGKAPSVALEPAFQKFKSWLLRIYKVASGTGVHITPEISAVFDRMLATKEEIDQVSKTPAFLLDTAMDDVLTKEERSRYEAINNRAAEQAGDNLFRKAIRQSEREKTQWWKDERAKTRADVEKRVNSDPVYRAMNYAIKGELLPGDDMLPPPPVKFSKKDAEAILGKTIMNGMPRGLFAKDGVSSDVMAQIMGYTKDKADGDTRQGTGTELLFAIANAEDRIARIERMTDEDMHERHGDMLHDGTIEQEAIESYHNDAQAMKIEMEGKIAARMAKLPFGTNTNFELAAQNILWDKRVQDAGNSDRFYRASVAAARAFGKAMKGKDYVAAVKAKQQQLLAHHLYKQSLQAKKTLERRMESWAKLQKADEKLSKSMDMNYVYAARAILGRYGILPYDDTKLDSYFRNIQQENPEAYEDLMLAVQENTKDVKAIEQRQVQITRGKLAGRTITQTKQPWTKMSYQEFLGLIDVVDNILGVGKNQRTMMVDGNRVERELVVSELSNRINELPQSTIADGRRKALETKDRVKLALLTANAANRRVEHWVAAMDGVFGGKFMKYIWNPVNDARNKYYAARHDMAKKMADLFVPNRERLNDGVSVYAPEIDRTFNSKAEIIGMLLHAGNSSNFDKLCRGYKWEHEKVKAMFDRMFADGTITKEDMDLTQSMWDLTKSLKPEAQKAHRAMYGYYFSEITAWPVETPWGTYEGGYWPAIADPELSHDARVRETAEQIISENAVSMFPTTGRGFTKERSEAYAAPLSMDLKLMTSHVDKVLRFIHLEPAIKDVAKLARDRNFIKAMERIDPRAIEDMLIPWLQRSARQSVEAAGKGGWFSQSATVSRWLRRTSSAQIMMFNLLNALQQVVGFAPIAYKVGLRNFGASFVDYLRNPAEANKAIYARSPYMQNEMTIMADNLQKSVVDIILNKNKYSRQRDIALEHGYVFQRFFQTWVSNTGWIAAYNQAVEKGMDEKEAVRYADNIVRTTQGSVSATDISQVEAGTATARMFTMFLSYFNNQANLLQTETQNMVRSADRSGLPGRLSYMYLMLYAIPSFMAEFIVKGIKGDLPEDKDGDGWVLDEWLSWFGLSQVRYATAMVPFAGQFANMVLGQFDDMPYNDRLSVSPVISTLETVGKLAKDVKKAADGRGDLSQTVQHALTTIGLATGLPLGQLGKPLGYAADVVEGDTRVKSPVDVMQGVIAGPPPASGR